MFNGYGFLSPDSILGSVAHSVGLTSFWGNQDQDELDLKTKNQESLRMSKNVTNAVEFHDNNVPTNIQARTTYQELQKFEKPVNRTDADKLLKKLRIDLKKSRGNASRCRDLTKKFKLVKNAIAKGQGLADEVVKNISRFMDALPVFAKKKEIQEAILKSDVLILTGETGSGKTTQTPQYISEAIEECKMLEKIVVCTQPSDFAAKEASTYVSLEFDKDQTEYVRCLSGFVTAEQKKSLIEKPPKVLYCSEFVLSELLADSKLNFLKYCGAIMLDEAHVRSKFTDTLLGILKSNIRENEVKLVISSATLQSEKFANYFKHQYRVNKIHIEGRKFPVRIENRDCDLASSKSTFSDMYLAISEELEDVYTREAGDILIFLPDPYSVKRMHKKLVENSKQMHGDIFFAVLTEYSTMKQRDEALDRRPTGYARKVILTTPYAETSVTIPGVVWIFDSGLAEIRKYNPQTQSVETKIGPITEASSIQRAGRGGRTKQGYCIRLYSEDYEFSPEVPEINRTSLDLFCLLLLRAGVQDIGKFDFLDRPSDKSLKTSIEVLTDSELMSSDEKCQQLTSTGRYCTNFDINPLQSKVLMEADRNSVLKLVCYMLALMKSRYLFSDANEALDPRLWAVGDHMIRFKMLMIYLSEKCSADCSNIECEQCADRRKDLFHQFSGPIHPERTIKSLRNALDTAMSYYYIAKKHRSVYTNSKFQDESEDYEEVLFDYYSQGNLKKFSEEINDLWSILGPILCSGLFQQIVAARGRTKDISNELDTYALYALPGANYQQNNLVSSKKPVNVKIDPASGIFTNNWNHLMPYFILINTSETRPGVRHGTMASPLKPAWILEKLPGRYHKNSKEFLQSNITMISFDNVGPGVWDSITNKNFGITIEDEHDVMLSWNEKTCTLTGSCLGNPDAVRGIVNEEIQATIGDMLSRTLQVDVGVRRMVVSAGFQVEDLPQLHQSVDVEIANIPAYASKRSIRRFLENFLKMKNMYAEGPSPISSIQKYYEPYRSFNVHYHQHYSNTFDTYTITCRNTEYAEAIAALHKTEVCTHGLNCVRLNGKCKYAPLLVRRKNMKLAKAGTGMKLYMECAASIDQETLYGFLGMLQASSVFMIQKPNKRNISCTMTFLTKADARNCTSIFSGTVRFTPPVPDFSDTITVPQSEDIDEKGNMVPSDGIYKVFCKDNYLRNKCAELIEKYDEIPKPEILCSPKQIDIASKSYKVAIRCELLKFLAPHSLYLQPLFVDHMRTKGIDKQIAEESKQKVFIHSAESRPYVQIYGQNAGEAAKTLREREKDFLRTHLRMVVALPASHNRARVKKELERIQSNRLWRSLGNLVKVQYIPIMNAVEITGLKDPVRKAHGMLEKSLEKLSSASEEKDEKEEEEENSCPCCEDTESERIPLRICGHSVCNTCWPTWLRSLIDKGKPLVCPVYECQKPITVGELTKELLGVEPDPFLTEIFIKHVKNNPSKYQMCKTDGCLNCFDLTPQQGSGKVSFQRHCFYCEKHSEFDAKETLEFLSQTFAQCPKCWRYVDRTTGCNHMTCLCRHEFCYVCNEDWKTHKSSATCHNNPSSKKNQVPVIG